MGYSVCIQSCASSATMFDEQRCLVPQLPPQAFWVTCFVMQAGLLCLMMYEVCMHSFPQKYWFLVFLNYHSATRCDRLAK